MAELIAGGPVGWALYAIAIGGALCLLIAAARRAGLLAPLLVGVGLRLVVLLAIHFLSVDIGDHGILFSDDAGYLREAAPLAERWAHGDLVDPAGPDYAGSEQFGYWAFVALVFVAVGENLLAAKLVNVLLAGAAILLAGQVARDVLGQGAARRAAWLLAIAPTLVWWSAPLLKETFALALLLAAVLCGLRLARGWPYLVGLAASLTALALTRGTAAIGVAAGLLVAYLIAGYLRRREIDWRYLVPRIAAALGLLLLVFIVLQSQRDLIDSYSNTFTTLRETYRGGSELSLNPADLARTMTAPFPWSFGETTDNWYRGLYPGLWFLFMLYPLALAGIWRMRARPELAVLLVPILVHVILATLSTENGLRVRSSIEPLLIILAVAGMWSWRRSAQLGAAGLAVAAAAAGVHQGSVLWFGGVLAVAAGLAYAARWLPDDGLAEEPIPHPLEEAFRSREGGGGDGEGSDRDSEPEPAPVSAAESPPQGPPGGG